MSIKKNLKGRWVADVNLYGGKRIMRTFDRERDARAFERRTRLEHHERRGEETPRYLIQTAIDDFKHTKAHLRPNTVKRYRSVFNRLKKFCSDHHIEYVDQFTPDIAKILYRELTSERVDPTGNTERMRKARPKTINMFLVTYKAFFAYEVAQQHLTKSPMAHIKSVSVEKQRPEYYTTEELAAFFQQRMPQAYREAFMGLLLTGMRFAELANLRWDDVDFENQVLRVVSRESHRTKTHNAVRAIPMNAELHEMLHEIQRNPRSTTFPFCSPTGKQLRERKLLAVCKDVADRAGIMSRAFLHKFRHTFATLLIQNEVRLEDIKELLGHSSITETEIYAHHTSDHLHDKVRVLSRIVGPALASSHDNAPR
jgi:site-specific recombinase XerD